MNIAGHQRRRDEEDTLPRDFYYSDAYFSQNQLFSLGQQVHEVWQTRCQELLEIGKGNGFVSEFLRRSGLSVTTLDVNASLQPDIVGDIDQLDSIFSEKSFECVLCAEVLEHIPFSKFESSVRLLRKHTNSTCIITLPRCDPPETYLINVKVRLPWIGERSLRVKDFLQHTNNTIYAGHHWEINCEYHCSLESIRDIMRRYFELVNDYRFELNPYHHFFILSV
jgi:2-polyprenyl-3-methyl-5-hydroxy-6-metoxy-1,4-benzoquinol methylase